MNIRDSDLHRLIDQYEDDNAEPIEPDGDSLRAAFAANPQWTRRRMPDPTVRECLAVIAGAIAVAALILAVLAVAG